MCQYRTSAPRFGSSDSVRPTYQHGASVPIQPKHQRGTPGRREHRAPGVTKGRERGRRAEWGAERGPFPITAPSPAGNRARCGASAGPQLPAGPGASGAPLPTRDLSSHSAQAQRGLAMPARPDPSPAVPASRRAPVPLRAAVRNPRCGARSAPSPAATGQPFPSPSPRGAAPRAHPGGPMRVALHLGEDEISGLEAVRHGGRGAGRRRRPRPRAAASNGAGTARPGPQDVPPLPQTQILLVASGAALPSRPMGRCEGTAG